MTTEIDLMELVWDASRRDAGPRACAAARFSSWSAHEIRRTTALIRQHTRAASARDRTKKLRKRHVLMRLAFTKGTTRSRERTYAKKTVFTAGKGS